MPVEEVDLKIPYIGGIKWKPDREEGRAAWSLYVELSTRITAVPLERGLSGERGSPRAAMNSLYQTLSAAREVLKAAGPSIAKTPESLGPITIRVLNDGIRRVLDRYHAPLQIHESERTPDVGLITHEREWNLYDQFWEEAEALQAAVQEYLHALEVMAGIQPGANFPLD